MKPVTAAVSRELKEAVVQFYEDYAETVDAQDLESWPEYFTDDCLYVVTARENYDAGLAHGTIYCEGIGMVRDRARATRDCTVYEPRSLRHFIHGVRITAVDGPRIESKASFLVVESVSDMEPYVHTVGQYVDTLVQGPEGLKLKQRYCVYDNYRIYNSLVFPI
jgi:anthranilate 1,2-dioxygenase small subunit